MVFRNLLTVMGIMAVVGVVFLIIKPDWIKQIASSPSPAATGPVAKYGARLCAERLRQAELPRDPSGFLHFEEQPTQKIVEELGEDLPSRNMPYMLIVNKATSTMRYCRLTGNVRKIRLKMNYPDVKVQEVATTPGGPYQVIVWIPQAMDLQLEFDVSAPIAPRT